MEDLDDDDDDLEACWAELEPLPSFVYTVDQCNGPDGVLGGFISRHEVVGADDECWLVASSVVAWSAPAAPKEIQLFPTARVPKVISFTTPTQSVEAYRGQRAAALIDTASQKAEIRKLIQNYQNELKSIEAREKTLEGINTPVLSNPITQFADIEKL